MAELFVPRGSDGRIWIALPEAHYETLLRQFRQEYGNIEGGRLFREFLSLERRKNRGLN